MIGATDDTEVRDWWGAGWVVPVVWVEVSAPLLGHPGQPAFRRLRATRVCRRFFLTRGPRPLPPSLWTLPGLPRPVYGHGSKKRFHSRPPSACKSPVKLEIPTPPWKTPKSTAFSTSAHRPYDCCLSISGTSNANNDGQLKSQHEGSGRG